MPAGMAKKFADFCACGYRKDASVNDAALARIDTCMRGRAGRSLDYIVPELSVRSQHARAGGQVSAPAGYRKFDQERRVATCHEMLGGIGEGMLEFLRHCGPRVVFAILRLARA